MNKRMADMGSAGVGDIVPVRELPEQDPRVETGPTMFGDDWTGVFIRGDDAFAYANALRMYLSRTASEAHRDLPISHQQLQALADLLESSDHRGHALEDPTDDDGGDDG